MTNSVYEETSNGYYFLYEWLAEIEDTTSPIGLPDLPTDTDTTTATTTSTPLTPPDSTLYPLTPPEVVITNEDGETRRLLPLVMSRLDTLEHFVTKVDIAMGKINDFMARVDLAMETMKGDLQSFSAGMVGLLRGWGLLPRTPGTTMVDVETGNAVATTQRHTE
ncbi:hypothetical protein F5B22DRAFT_587841 [Xylaria bambusicola]|uniref:uncharacterized protein n=1 Tax=Xylaria bambusicola TaxID=326684 RepID=UPI0020072423|nr:uncharacterized protein F5B22DRAFT_587841 [Xylaria bambusicola]KAI0525809.1 hypothetical protein F5B22DRAFT_587841 [Xylaria bambusicola]